MRGLTKILGKLLKSPTAKSIGQTALGGAIAASVTPYTQQLAQDSTGRELSTVGKNTNLLGNVAAGMLLGNPSTRRLFLQKDVTGKVLKNLQKAESHIPVGKIPNVYKTRLISGPLSMAAAASLPTTAAYLGDGTKATMEAVNTMVENPQVRQRVFDQAAQSVKRNITQPAVNSLSLTARSQGPMFLGPLGLTVGAGVVGAPIGYLAGNALAGTIAPDDDKLTYVQRRRREHIRSLASALGGYAGALGAGYLANRYAPQIADAWNAARRH